MHTTTTCCDDPCGCEESAFARLRYSYGQRLTAVDLLDEQAYLIGKDRFVARHVLGAGILCGLRAVRGDGPPERHVLQCQLISFVANESPHPASFDAMRGEITSVFSSAPARNAAPSVDLK